MLKEDFMFKKYPFAFPYKEGDVMLHRWALTNQNAYRL